MRPFGKQLAGIWCAFDILSCQSSDDAKRKLIQSAYARAGGFKPTLALEQDRRRWVGGVGEACAANRRLLDTHGGLEAQVFRRLKFLEQERRNRPCTRWLQQGIAFEAETGCVALADL